MSYARIEHNGREIFVPEAGITGAKLIEQIAPNMRPGRRASIVNGSNSERIESDKKYYPKDFYNNRGKQKKFVTIPPRTKGGWLDDLIAFFRGDNDNARPRYTQVANTVAQPQEPQTSGRKPQPLFWGERTGLSKRIILEQCYDLAKNMFPKNRILIDERHANTFVVADFPLPKKWLHVPGVENGKTELAIVFPTEYPKIAPIGFYMKATIKDAPNGHFYTSAYHDADKVMLTKGWKWYCVYVTAGNWEPAPYRAAGDWRYGDNIWTYFDLIKEALTSND